MNAPKKSEMGFGLGFLETRELKTLNPEPSKAWVDPKP